MEAYEQVQKGPLKLKGVAELGVTKRKKKKKDKDKAKMLEAMGTSKKNEEEKRRCLDKRTPAQAAFEKMQEKRQMERILKKASKTHKQRVEVSPASVGRLSAGVARAQAWLECLEAYGGVCEMGCVQAGILPIWFTLMWSVFHRTSTDTWTHSPSTMTSPKSAGPSNLALLQKAEGWTV
ncbi:protein FAM32A isoform X1 [Rattus norvegicus]|uniref:Protein FAM32A n=1 Tax=Rattus norvegicus TaxID=10116 RepID=A0A8I6AF17_RAT